MSIHVYSCCNFREWQDLVVFTGKVDGRYLMGIQISPFNILNRPGLFSSNLVNVPAKEYSPSSTCSIVDSKQS